MSLKNISFPKELLSPSKMSKVKLLLEKSQKIEYKKVLRGLQKGFTVGLE
jgi:hypothetical protein